MISNEIDEKKTKYFVIAIILLIVLSVILIIHFNNKSLVSGNEEDVNVTTTTVTTTVTTTKKKKTTKKIETVPENEETEELVSDNVVYKSAIDEVNKLIYNYKLSDEISNDDVIISKVIGLTESLKTNNVIALYDISLYDKEGTKKSVKNTVIDISIPLSKDMLDYDEYKVIYIDDKDVITEEKFEVVVENNYIKFSTSHLSKFGIVGIKKEVFEEIKPEEDKEEIVEDIKPEEEQVVIDLTNVDIDVSINDEVKEENNLYVSTIDKIDVMVNGIDTEYKLYYLLKNDKEINEYKELKDNIFEGIETPSKYTLLIKLVVGDVEKVFEVGIVNVYDIVFVYDKEETLKEDIIIGEIKDEEGIESDYIEPSENMNIVIDSVLKEEITDEDNQNNKEDEPEEEVEGNTGENKDSQNELPEQNNETEETIDEENNQELEPTNPEENQNDNENLEDKASIVLKGNVYLVEKTDISNLEITGYLIIDTSEDITFNKNENNELLTSNIYTITIRSKEFSINGVKYTYEYKENDLIIKKIDEENNQEVDANLEINNLFKDFDIIKDDEDLILANPYN